MAIRSATQASIHRTGRAIFMVSVAYQEIKKALFQCREERKNMTKERIDRELSKVRAQLETLQAKQKDLEEQKRMAERAEKMDIIEKNKISSEKLQLLIKLSEDEILQLLAEKEKKKEMAENEEKVIS